MAVRTGAGTGVVVSLVVFVMTTVALLVLSIIFYAGKAREAEERAKAENTLAAYIKPAQRNSDAFKAFEDAARARNESVAGFLHQRYDQLASFTVGKGDAPIDNVRSDFARYNVGENDNVLGRMRRMSQDLNAQKTEIENLNNQLKRLNDTITERDTQLAQLKQSHQQEVEGFNATIASYREAAEDYRNRLDGAISDLNQAKDSLRASYETQVNRLQNENDNLYRELGVLKEKISQLERARDEIRMKGRDPSLLVDAKIVDAPGAGDQVYIDRGRKDRIVEGMTFEVYSDFSQIRINPVTGEIPRGKASLQVMKVNDSTSTCKITRSSPGQPVVRGDVVANAIYDPTYKFKFFVHGRFDVDLDGRPTEEEAEYLRSLAVQWGGSVVTGETLPGDLDFLVLGVEPPKPSPLPPDPSPVLINDWLRRNEAHEKYNLLFRQAREAQIPVLNANRFFILIGHTDR